jgi:hypothetical protein
MNRRQFLRAGGAGTISLTAFPHHLFAADKKKLATDRILLGPRKIAVSRLAMGTGTRGSGGSSAQTRNLGYQGLPELMRAAYDRASLQDRRPIRHPPTCGALRAVRATRS